MSSTPEKTSDSAAAPDAAAARLLRLPPLTRGAWSVFVVAAVLFVIAVSLRLNGSSSGLWATVNLHDIQVRDSGSGVLAGTPRYNRGDEWFIWTPAMLSQARQPQPFPASNPSLGPGVTPLLMSLPAHHYTMLFRPQLWGFFVAPFEYGFAWYWNLKIFGLFAALFALCWVLTDGQLGIALFGAVAIQFSGFVQWWFSTPAMLPEMLACWSVAVIAAISFFLPRKWHWHLVSGVVFVFAFANFALCCYPAFAIPLLYLAAAVVGGYVWQRRCFSWRGMAFVATALATAVAVLIPWIIDCLPTLRIEAQTVYPGQRHTYGGGLPLLHYLSGLLTFEMDEKHFPPSLGNACEAANFFPLWLLPVVWGACKLSQRVWHRQTPFATWLADRGLMVALVAYLAGLTLYMLMPLPHWFCDATLLSRTMETRALLGTGLAGSLLLVAWIGSRPARGPRDLRFAITVFVLTSLGVKGLFAWAVHSTTSSPAFAYDWSTIILAGDGALLLLLCTPRRVLPAVWSVALLVKLALVNPVCAGLPPLLESPAMNQLREIVQADPVAEWAVYESFVGVELIKSTGAHVINGAKIIPDFAVIDRLDPAHEHLDQYNQYSYLYFADADYQEKVRVSIPRGRQCRVEIHPRRLRELFPRVKYIAATSDLTSLASAGFELIGRVPENNLHLYRLNPALPVSPGAN